MLWWICWVCVFKHARHQLKKKKHIHWVKNQSNQTPHSIFTQHKTHFDYAPQNKAITFTVPKTPICPGKKKVQQLNKTQMRKLKWDCPIEREREREFCETERVERKRSLLGMTDLFDFKLVTSLKCWKFVRVNGSVFWEREECLICFGFCFW